MTDSEDTYPYGKAQGLDKRYFAPDGEPWCRFGRGFRCINGDQCQNPNHREDN